MKTIRIAVLGFEGRMGVAIIRLARETPGVAIASVTSHEGSLRAGEAARALGLAGVSTLKEATSSADVLVDFTVPLASLNHARVAAAARRPLVIGTTGFDREQRAELQRLARDAPLLVSPNMSIGINVMLTLVRDLAKRLGPEWDAEVLEIHHRMKRDAPSGTAKRIAEEIVASRGGVTREARAGDVGARPALEVGVQAIRGGDVAGEHTAYFIADGERLEVTHRASNRDPFARGALRAAQWLAEKPPGLYDMADVLA